MIISASRRTDIPNYYAQWFLKRLQQKYVLVRNPLNRQQVARVELGPEVVDCIVFWTKNPEPLMAYLSSLRDYCYYFHFTLNPYEKDIEPNVPPLTKRVETFKRLAAILGASRVVWRYDPILFNEKYTEEFHLYSFAFLAEQLKDSTEKCVISFLNFYNKISANVKALGIKPPEAGQKCSLAVNLLQIARGYGLQLESCAENLELSAWGLGRAKCIDAELIARIGGYSLQVGKDKNQRPECGCVESIDIGAYNICLNGCKYCYANYSPASVRRNVQDYCVSSPLLCSRILPADSVYRREVKSLKKTQLTLFPKI